MFKVTKMNNHLHVEFEGKVTLATILAAVVEVFRHPDYVRLNVLWMFGDADLFLKQEDLDVIVQAIEESHPRDMQRNKSALVAHSGFNQFLAEAFEKMAGHLPYQIKIFQNVPDAEEWLAGGQLSEGKGTA